MTDELDKLSDKELEKLEQKLHKLYKDASESMSETIKEYFADFERRDAQMKKVMESGEITKEQYTQWRLAQIGRGKRFEDLRDKLAERMTKANEVAAAYVNDATPGIYSLNMNYTAYEIEKAHGNIGFTVWDDETIRRLALDEPELMPYYPPKRAVKRGIDLAYGARQITAQVTSSILLGDSVYDMADKLQGRIEEMSRTSAIRAARTASTAAQNGGRQASYERAAAMGIPLRKRWIATKDMRTRHEHGVADGQTVPFDEPFTVGGEKLMFPGDATAASGWNLYNCRCSMRTVEKDGIEAEPRMMRVRDPVTGRNKLVKEMTYDEWYDYHSKVDKAGLDLAKKKAKNASADHKQWKTYKKILGSKIPDTLADFQTVKYNTPEIWEKLKVQKQQTVFVNNAPCETTKKKYTHYFLKEGAKHAEEFFRVGYTKDDALQLRYDMAVQFDISNTVDHKIENGVETFNQYMELGVTKKKRFITCWRKDTPDSIPRIITSFRKDD